MVRHSNTWVFNIRQHNWPTCVDGPSDPNSHGEENVGEPWSGVRSDSEPDIRRGDLVLARRAWRGGDDQHGVLGIWRFHDYRKISSQSEVPWSDGAYTWVLYCRAIQREFAKPFVEDWDAFSFDQRAIQVSYRSLSSQQAREYRQALTEFPLVSEGAKEDLK